MGETVDAGSTAVVVESLGKRFRERRDRPSTLKELLVRGNVWRTPAKWFWGLSDVSFRVAKGSMLGVVGHNGAGKSTLLRLIGGVGEPDAGKIQTRGNIGALLELGAGFHPDLSGRENAILMGVIAGLTRREVLRRFDTIVQFAELQHFIDAPLRTYSSGMSLRLAFSVAAHTDPDILLIDEVLAVGDLGFQRKCVKRIHEVKSAGAAIILVSHDTEQVKRHCDQALWLRHGKVASLGDTATVVDAYTSEMARISQAATPLDRDAVTLSSGRCLKVGQNRFGTLELELRAVCLRDRYGAPINEITNGGALVVELELFSENVIVSPIVCVSIRNDQKQICYDTNTEIEGFELGTIEGIERIRLTIERLDLAGGDYDVNVGVYERRWAFAYDEHSDAYPLRVRPTPGAKGMLAPPQRWERCTANPTVLRDALAVPVEPLEAPREAGAETP
ncbi:MAG TPA: ABC transporter ATP-binding protein [Polyangiaceae bacterium]